MTENRRLEIPAMPRLRVVLEGETPLLQHRMSEKVRKELRDAHMAGKAGPEDSVKVSTKKALEPRDPIAEALNGLYIIGKRPTRKEIKISDDELDGIDPELGLEIKLPMPKGSHYGFLSRAFKQCLARAAQDRNLPGSKDTISLISARTRLWAFPSDRRSNLLQIDSDGDTITLREDFVSIGMGKSRTKMLRWRFAIYPWRASVVVGYDPEFFRVDTVARIIQAAGNGVGLGEWRSERGGDFGLFRIDSIQDLST